jgi:hypothetical protein
MKGLRYSACNVIAAKLAAGLLGGAGGFTSNSQKDITFAVTAPQKGRAEFFVDSVPSTVPQSGRNVGYVPSLESVEEAKVHTSLFDAAYGHFQRQRDPHHVPRGYESIAGYIIITTSGFPRRASGVSSPCWTLT